MRAATHKIPWELTVKAKARPEDGRAFCFLSVPILPKCEKLHANFFAALDIGRDVLREECGEAVPRGVTQYSAGAETDSVTMTFSRQQKCCPNTGKLWGQ